ncbi:hypothetical protein L596_024677 [Steinernema carpocapsae]|uniref:Uncharacterized protein n=1 Tax=Steinernema carpocapsae TaxID=34508 RepID=A0A4U5M5H2_STECR|nr:hypothetical protein L596_024677 [Steinernema carpocapsae]
MSEDKKWHEFKLISPASKEPLIFMVTPENQVRVGSEIVEIVKIACTIFTELKAVLDRSQPIQTVEATSTSCRSSSPRSTRPARRSRNCGKERQSRCQALMKAASSSGSGTAYTAAPSRIRTP